MVLNNQYPQRVHFIFCDSAKVTFMLISPVPQDQRTLLSLPKKGKIQINDTFGKCWLPLFSHIIVSFEGLHIYEILERDLFLFETIIYYYIYYYLSLSEY
jgi:hypothetical protein